MYKYQVTISCSTGQYKPVSCIIKTDKAINLKDHTAKMQLVNKGIVKICGQRRWRNADLKRYSYTRVKVREYNKEAIKLESIDKYRSIKKAKYNNGE